MLRWIKSLLQKQDVRGVQYTFDTLANKNPIPGQLWALKGDDGDPFGPKRGFCVVKILEVRDGWVRYYMNKIWDDERKPIKNFTNIYRLYQEDSNANPQ